MDLDSESRPALKVVAYASSLLKSKAFSFDERPGSTWGDCDSRDADCYKWVHSPSIEKLLPYLSLQPDLQVCAST